MRRRLRLAHCLLGGGLLLAGSCFEPAVPDGLACSPSAACPPAQFCEANTHVCYADGTTDVGVATRLVFMVHPSSVVANHRMDLVRVHVVDQRGQRLLNATSPVQLELLDGAGVPVALGGTIMRDAVAGAASFDDLVPPTRGTFTLRATATGLPTLTSPPIEVLAVDFDAPIVRGPGGPDPWVVAIADVNSDGRGDVLTANQGGSTVSVFLSAGDLGIGVIAFDIEVGLAPMGLAVADFNLDMIPDLVVSSSPGGTAGLHWFPGRGGGDFGSFEGATALASGPQTFLLTAADLDDDTKPDLVSAGPGALRTVWFNNTMAPTSLPTFFSTALTCPDVNDVHAVAVGDLDEDGRLDVVSAGHEGLCVVRGKPGSPTRQFLPAQARPEAGFYPSLGLADLRGSDLLDAVTVQGQVDFRVCEQSSGGTLAAAVQILGGTPQAGALATGDIDGDGLDDVVIVDGSTTIHVLLQESDGQLTDHPFAVPESAVAVAIGDVTGDGVMDLAVTGQSLMLLVGR